MLTIIHGSLAKVKAELKQVKQWKASEEKTLKKQIREWEAAEKKKAKEEKREADSCPKEWDQKLMELDGLQKMFSSVIPVKVNELIIDYKTYEKVVKKLVGFEITIQAENNQVVMDYKKGKAKGSVHFYDLSSFFHEFKHIPVADVQIHEEQ